MLKIKNYFKLNDTEFATIGGIMWKISVVVEYWDSYHFHNISGWDGFFTSKSDSFVLNRAPIRTNGYGLVYKIRSIHTHKEKEVNAEWLAHTENLLDWFRIVC